MTVLWDDSFGPSVQPGDSTSGDFKSKTATLSVPLLCRKFSFDHLPSIEKRMCVMKMYDWFKKDILCSLQNIQRITRKKKSSDS